MVVGGENGKTFKIVYPIYAFAKRHNIFSFGSREYQWTANRFFRSDMPAKYSI